jgi:hypothetical protein
VRGDKEDVGKESQLRGKGRIIPMMPEVKEYAIVRSLEVNYESPDVHQLRQ